MNALPIRIGGLNTQLSEVRDFGRANAMRNCEITKCNQVERRKGYIRRLNVQQAGPIRMLHAFKGICGRFYSYSDGGGLVFISGNNYTSPFGFAAALGNSIDLSWSYRDSSGVRDTPPEGCTGIRVYRSYTGYATAFDSGTLIYEGAGTSCVDPSPTITGIVYYTAYTTWSHQERIESPLIVMAWAAYVPAGSTSPTPPAIPDVPGSPANACGPSGGGSGPVTSSGGSVVIGSGINRESDEVSQAAAEEAIDEEEDIDFLTTVDLASVNHVDLTWKFRGDSQYNSGFVTIYRSTTSGTGSTGTLIYRSSVGSMWGETADTSLDEYSSDYYYTFFFFVDGVGVYSYEKFTEKQSRSLVVVAPASVYNSTAFSLTITAKHWTGDTDSSFVPESALTISVDSGSVSPETTSISGWSGGSKTVSTTLTGAVAAVIITVASANEASGTDTAVVYTYSFLDQFNRATVDGDGYTWSMSGGGALSIVSGAYLKLTQGGLVHGYAAPTPSMYAGLPCYCTFDVIDPDPDPNSAMAYGLYIDIITGHSPITVGIEQGNYTFWGPRYKLQIWDVAYSLGTLVSSEYVTGTFTGTITITLSGNTVTATCSDSGATTVTLDLGSSAGFSAIKPYIYNDAVTIDNVGVYR